MELKEMHCPNCTATLTVDADSREAVCEYCGSVFKIEDTLRDARDAGYEFERGRMEAREEMLDEQNESFYSAQPKKRRTWLWVLGWIFMPYIPATILIARSNLNKVVKGILIALIWILVLAIGYYYDDDGANSNANGGYTPVSTQVYEQYTDAQF